MGHMIYVLFVAIELCGLGSLLVIWVEVHVRVFELFVWAMFVDPLGMGKDYTSVEVCVCVCVCYTIEKPFEASQTHLLPLLQPNELSFFLSFSIPHFSFLSIPDKL